MLPRIQRVCTSKASYFLLLAIVLICFHPRDFFELSTDDYMAIYYLGGSNTLHQAGILPDNSDESFWQQINQTFHFFSEKKGTIQSLKNYGALPWWAPDDGRMHMFRPLSALTHWVDVKFFPKNYSWAYLHSTFWYVLMALSMFVLFRKFLGQTTTAFLAVLLYILDASQIFNFNWLAARNGFIAPMFACWCLLFFAWYAEGGGKKYFLASITALVCALMSAEAGLASCAYLFSYVVFVDPRGFKKGVLWLLPFAAVVVAWRVYYSLSGFGAKNIGLYVDPLNAPWAFIESLGSNYFVLVFSLITGTDSSLPALSPNAALLLRGVALVTVLLCVYAVFPLLKRQRTMAFFFVGSALAVIPFCALTFNNPRSVFMAAIGFFPVLAVWAIQLWNTQREGFKKLLSRSVLAAVLVLLVAFPLIVSLSMFTPFPLLIVESGSARNSMTGGAPIENEQGVVYLRYPMGLTLYLPYTWDTMGRTLPNNIFQFVPGINSFSLERVSEREFLLCSDYQFVLHHQVPVRGDKEAKRIADPLMGLAATQSMTATPARIFQAGEEILLEHMRVVIHETEQGVPTQLSIHFSDQINPNELEWRDYDWSSGDFSVIVIPAVGELRYFANLWDASKTAGYERIEK